MSDLIRDEFKRVFKDFIYPYVTSDQLLRLMPVGKRQKYLREAEKINKSEVIIQELNEICRHLYYQLAIETKKGDDAELLYKGALLFSSIFKRRLNQLALSSPEEWEKSVNKANEIINQIMPNV